MNPGSFYIGINIDFIITKFYSILYHIKVYYTNTNHASHRAILNLIMIYLEPAVELKVAGSDLDKGAAPHKINIPISQYSLHTGGTNERGRCAPVAGRCPEGYLIKLACVNCWISKCIDFPPLWGHLQIDPLLVH